MHHLRASDCTGLLQRIREILRRSGELFPETVNDTPSAVVFQPLRVFRDQLVQNLRRGGLGELSVRNEKEGSAK
jgi:hypothetical protein